MTVAVITGGRDRTPTLAELERLTEVLEQLGATKLRHGDCPERKRDGRIVGSTDRSVAAYVKARGLAEVEPWPAEDHGAWPWCGPKRNRAMLDGDGQPDLFRVSERPPAQLLVAFAGGDGTADCVEAAGERGVRVETIEPVDEPRPWNRHHGEPPGPSLYVGAPSPLANPWRDWRAHAREGETRDVAAARILELYARWLWRRIRPDSSEFDPRVVAELERITPNHYLVCSCWPRHCHAEIVIRAWRWHHRRQAKAPAAPRYPAARTAPGRAPAHRDPAEGA